MAKTLNEDALTGLWVHSHEEDTDKEMVFRPRGFRFPPARGRNSFELKPGGNLVMGGIAPNDQSATADGVWKLEDKNKLAFYSGSNSTPDQVLEIVSADKDRLIVKK
jgi:hypothetical protein